MDRNVSRAASRALFDAAGSEAWRLIVYDPVHKGWQFANIGGRRVLDSLARHAHIGSRSAVLEIGCGLGDTCCYLASRYRCRVTGADVNQTQLRQARVNLWSRRPRAIGHVTFLHRDVGRWWPHGRYDAALAVDTLMYVPRREDVLRRLYHALRPGGTLLVADVFSGPRMSDHLRGQLRDAEGVVALPTAAEQRQQLTDAGFHVVSARNRTRLAVDVFRIICEANRRYQRQFEAMGAARFGDVESNALHERAFRREALVYWSFIARRERGIAQARRRTSVSRRRS